MDSGLHLSKIMCKDDFEFGFFLNVNILVYFSCDRYVSIVLLLSVMPKKIPEHLCRKYSFYFSLVVRRSSYTLWITDHPSIFSLMYYPCLQFFTCKSRSANPRCRITGSSLIVDIESSLCPSGPSASTSGS